MRIIWLLAVVLCTGGQVLSQSHGRMSRTEYFETYREMAVHEMHRSGVPASITLAQGALESGDGNSTLARIANNHFGIKCHNDWNGKKIYYDDDAKNECFRKYPSVEDSYRDHSDYLREKQRYAFLFELDLLDYKGWARGLKKAGYATNPSYASKLIEIIDEYGLHRYDRMGENTQVHHRRPSRPASYIATRAILEKNRVKYVLAEPGDTYESLTREFGKLDWEIPGYNDVHAGDSLFPGQVVFIQPKRNKAEVGNNVHILKSGETIYTVSQRYAIKLARLYSMNLLNPGTRVSPGVTLQLRKPLKRPLPAPPLKEEIPAGGEEQEEIKVELNLE
ncbi:MAG: glucosaminidase domain-containing protein [Bacteroidales bacterium]|nr:glucosaminidase domain-containing protein [Bacteroidales bacterium]